VCVCVCVCVSSNLDKDEVARHTPDTSMVMSPRVMEARHESCVDVVISMPRHPPGHASPSLCIKREINPMADVGVVCLGWHLDDVESKVCNGEFVCVY
jgi:hypothetical protein